jgi:predicted ribosomally synthesized peptide with SipW-like signal peptide
LKKRFLILAMTVALVCALVGGATFALFTDSATNSAKDFTAGTVTIGSVRDNGDTVPGPMFYTTREQGMTTTGQPGKYPTGLWKPGDTNARVLVLYNKGSLEARLTRIKASVDPTASDIQPGSDAYREFINKMYVKITAPGMPSGTIEVYNGTLAELIGDGSAANGSMVLPVGTPDWPSPNVPLTFECHLDISAGNFLQGTNPVFGFVIVAEQDKNNP